MLSSIVPPLLLKVFEEASAFCCFRRHPGPSRFRSSTTTGRPTFTRTGIGCRQPVLKDLYCGTSHGPFRS